MKKRIIPAAIAVVITAAIVCALWFALLEGSKGILYRVTGDGSTAYLLGSIHIGTSEMHPFGDALQDAMEASDIFIFECDTDSDASLTQLKARQVLPENVSLRELLGDTLTDDIASAYRTLRLSTASLDGQQPWAVINTLALYSSAAEMGVKNIPKAVSLGVEATVQNYANGHQKAFAYLETVDEIADTMESFSDGLIRYLLQDEIDVILSRKDKADVETIAQWPGWWRDGNAEAFRDFYRQSFKSADPQIYAEYQEKLLTRRNLFMANRLDAMLRQGGDYFVTIGLLHLVSEDNSILSLLRDMGYSVERVSRP